MATPFTTMAANLKCVTYTDENSVNGSSFQDLMLGLEHKILGCNTNLFMNDMVLLTATKDKKRYVVVVRLEERLVDCTLWLDHGGKHWLHNFRFQALTGLQQVDEPFRLAMKEFGIKHGLNPNNLLNSRFCSAKMWPLMQELLDAKMFAPLM